MANIKGVVDNFRSFRQFGGWARHTDGTGSKLKIRAYLDEKLVGESLASLHRSDLKADCGFEIQLSEDVILEDIEQGKLKFFALKEDLTQSEIKFFSSTLKNFELRCLGRKLAEGNDADLRQVLAGLIENDKNKNPLLKHISSSLNEFMASTKPARFIGDESSYSLSSFPMRVGVASSDGSAVVGHDGMMFILHGANSLIEQYSKHEEDQDIQDKSDAWLETFRNRKVGLDGAGSRFLQLIIPEKSTIFPRCFPIDVKAPTALMKAITNKIKSDKFLKQSYVDCELVLNFADRKESTFRRMDSHLSAYGAYLVMQSILRQLGQESPIPVSFLRRETIGCDLGVKFSAAMKRDEHLAPAHNEVSHLEEGLKQTDFVLPANGGHIGTKITWNNTSALTNLRVVAFGNSFFEKGEFAGHLSWWSARFFREFHFHWSPVIDMNYIQQVRPDLVICQTIERFLPRVPKN